MKKFWLIALTLVAVLACTVTMLALPAMAEDLGAGCEHLWDAGVVTVERTHTSTGIKTFTCKKCGETEDRETPKLPVHVWSEWASLNDTQHQRTCECGEVQTLKHFWDSIELVREATHLETGLQQKTCRDCGFVLDVVLEKTAAHTFGEWTVGDAEQHQAVCECGEVKTGKHLWDSGTITKEATHTEAGVKTFTCKHCGATKEQALSKLLVHEYGYWTKSDEKQHVKICACGDTVHQNHVWDIGVVTVEPTMHEKGEKTYTCVECEETKVEPVLSIFAQKRLVHDRALHALIPNNWVGVAGLALIAVLAIIAFKLKKKVVR